MRMIQAIVAPERLKDVAARLADAEIHRMTVSEVHGVSDIAGVAFAEASPEPMVRLEVGVNEDFVEAAVTAIEQGGGDRGRSDRIHPIRCGQRESSSRRAGTVALASSQSESKCRH